MAMKTPRAKAYEYCPVATGPRSREMTVNNTRLEKSAVKRQMDSQSAFLTTITTTILKAAGERTGGRASNRTRKLPVAGTKQSHPAQAEFDGAQRKFPRES